MHENVIQITALVDELNDSSVAIATGQFDTSGQDMSPDDMLQEAARVILARRSGANPADAADCVGCGPPFKLIAEGGHILGGRSPAFEIMRSVVKDLLAGDLDKVAGRARL